MIRNITLCILLFAFQFSFSQEKIDELFNAFDKYNTELQIQLISELESNPIEIEGLDELRFNLFKLIKFNTIPYEDGEYKTREYAKYFKSSIDYFLEQNLITHLLPFFLNKYGFIYMDLDKRTAKKYLENSMEIAEYYKGKQLYLYPSVVEKYNSLEYLGLLDPENKEQYVRSKFELFIENKETIEPHLTPYRINSLISLSLDATAYGLFNYYKEKDLSSYFLDLAIRNIDFIGLYEIMHLMDMAVSFKLKKGINEITTKFSSLIKDIKDKDSAEYFFMIRAGYKYYNFIGRSKLAYYMVLEVINHSYFKAMTDKSYNAFNNAFGFNKDDNPLFEFEVILDFLTISISMHRDMNYSEAGLNGPYWWIDYLEGQVKFFYSLGRINDDTYSSYNNNIDALRTTYFYLDQEFDKVLDYKIDFNEGHNDTQKYNMLRYKLIAKYKTGGIEYKDFSNSLNSLHKTYNQEFDEIDFMYIQANSFTKATRIDNLKKALQDVDFINNLSYESQLNLIEDLYAEFSPIARYFFNNKPNTKDIKDIHQLILDIDNIDKYNSRLLSLNNQDQNKYFELLNKRRDITLDDESYHQFIFEFDSFQQEIKSKFKSQERLSLDDFQKKIGDNEAYIRIYQLMRWDDNDIDNYIGFIYLKDNLFFVKFDNVELVKIRDYYTSSIINEIDDQISYEYLFKPIRNKLPDNISKIYIKNDGIFNNINLETLYIPDSKSYVMGQYDIEYVEKPNSLFTYTDYDFKNAFLFGNPLFNNGQGSSTTRSSFSQLPNTKIEIDEINDLLINSGIKSIKTNGLDSNEQNFYANSNSDIIHIATHGFYKENEMRKEGFFSRFDSGLIASNYDHSVLGKSSTSAGYLIDGVIHGGEILFKNFTKNKLLILSACETGVGESTYLGTETLANAFLRAGSKNIISTLWPVDDEITKDFMVEFYRNLIISNNIAKALSKTKEKFKQTYSHPKYWGAFVLLSNSI